MSFDKQRMLGLIGEVELAKCEGPGPVGWVYFIMCPATQRCKIGFTKGAVEKRLASLQTGSASQLAAIVMHPGTPDTERELHGRFASSRLHGEWFDLTDELRAYMIAALWAMTEFTLKQGQRLPRWMASGVEISLEHLESLPETLIELLEADPA